MKSKARSKSLWTPGGARKTGFIVGTLTWVVLYSSYTKRRTLKDIAKNVEKLAKRSKSDG